MLFGKPKSPGGQTHRYHVIKDVDAMQSVPAFRVMTETGVEVERFYKYEDAVQYAADRSRDS